MDNEENTIVTEVGKFTSPTSTPDPAGEDEALIKSDNRSMDVPADFTKSTINLSTNIAMDKEVIAPFLVVDELNKTFVKKADLLNVLNPSDEDHNKLKEELSNLEQEEVTVRCFDDGRMEVMIAEKSVPLEENLLKGFSQHMEAVIRKPRPWVSLGSESEVAQGITQNTRPLIELEMEVRIEDMKRGRSLTDKSWDVVSFGPSRNVCPGVRLDRMDASVQAVPELKSASAQKRPGLPVNACTQYVYDLEGADGVAQVKGRDLPPDYKFSGEEQINRALEYNETFNLYTNDYPLLVKQEEDVIVPETASFTPFDALTDVRNVGGQVVASIAWHPMHAGKLAVLYAPQTRALLYDKTAPKTVLPTFQRNVVLLWNIQKPLKPELVLTSPREMTAIRWCPVNANLLVGACVSGQVVLWDLAGVADSNKTHKELSNEQKHARKVLHDVLFWVADSKEIVQVPAIALSNLAFSHSGQATALEWLNPYYRLNSEGQFNPTTGSKFSLQFMTCGEDCTVLVWDLDLVPPDAAKLEKTLKTEAKYEEYTSRFKFYHRTMRPIYKIIPQIDNGRAKTILTSLAVENYNLEYVLDPVIPVLKINGEAGSDVPVSPYYENYHVVYKFDKQKPSQMIWLGTDDGLVIHLNWQGFAFEKSEEIASEIVEMTGVLSGIHDGPITEIHRSPLIHEYLLIIGGHVMSIWNELKSDRPVLTRRAPVRLASAAWSAVRPSLLRIGRLDGTLEVWDFLYRSDCPTLEQSFSGNPLTAVANYPFKLPDGRRALAVADYRSALHLFNIPVKFQTCSPTDVQAMRTLLVREKSIRERYEVWNEAFSTEHAHLIQHQKVTEETKPQQLEKKREQKDDSDKKVKPKQEPPPVRDEKKMLATLLQQKHLDKDELIAKQKPLLVLKQMAEEKKEKIKMKMMQQQEEHDKVVSMLLPEETVMSIGDEAFELALKEQVREEIKTAMENWQSGSYKQSAKKSTVSRTVNRTKVLREGAQRRVIIDDSLNARDWRQERFLARRSASETNSLPVVETAGSPLSGRTSLAISDQNFEAISVAQKAGYPWQTEGGPHLPGGAVSVAHQFLRCILHQLAPNGVFVQLFHSQIQEKTRIGLFKGVAQSLIDFPELTPSSPILLLLETLNAKKSIAPESVAIVCRNMAIYLELIPGETGSLPPGSPWPPLLVQMDLFFRRIVLLLPTLEDILAPVSLMPLLLKLPGISSCKAILDPFSKILSYAIQNVVVESHVVVELCQLCGRAFSRDREKLALTRMLIIELVQALKFKTTMPDTNFITLINFVIQDTGNCLVQTGLISCSPDSFTTGTNAAEIMRQHLADALDFLADFHTVSKIKSFCQGDTNGLNEDTLGGALKSGVAQYVALEMSRGTRDNRAVARHLPWLYNAPSSLQQGPKEFLECMGHVRLLSWLLLGGLFQSLSIHAPCTPVPPEASCHVADHIQVILAGFAEQSKASVLHMSSLFHAFILCQLWTVYLEAGANSNLPGSEPHIAQNTILLDFWGKVTPCILQLVAHSKVLAEMVNLHFLSLLEALLEVNASILGKLMPLWTPVLFAHHFQAISKFGSKIADTFLQRHQQITPFWQNGFNACSSKWAKSSFNPQQQLNSIQFKPSVLMHDSECVQLLGVRRRVSSVTFSIMNRSQRSKSSSSSRLESSGRDSGSSELNLTVHGSPCPRGPRPQKKPVQPPNSPARPLILPIDRLIQYRSEIGKLEEGCSLSGRSSSVSSSHPELAIDLSSLSDSYHTQRSSDSSYDESEWSLPWFPKRNVKVEQISSRRSPSSISVPRTYEKIFSRNGKSSRTNESICSRCSSKLQNNTTDLIEVYVKTVNNTELSKFFRPCPLCGQQTCNCPSSPKSGSCNERNCQCSGGESASCRECGLKYCLCLPKNVCFDAVETNSRRSDILQEGVRRRIADQTVDSGNSTLQLDDSCRDIAARVDSGILSRQHVSLSVMQLATAAQCARILADSLENVLQLAREELTPEASRRSTLLESAFPQDTLLSAINALNKTSTDCTAEGNGPDPLPVNKP